MITIHSRNSFLHKPGAYYVILELSLKSVTYQGGSDNSNFCASFPAHLKLNFARLNGWNQIRFRVAKTNGVREVDFQTKLVCLVGGLTTAALSF